MKVYQAILFASTLSFTGCGSNTSSDVDFAETAVAESFVADDELIDEAITIVQGASAPMLGIKTLLSYADSDAPSVKANFWLGKFGVQSEQFEKAKDRFLKVLEIDPKHNEAFLNLLTLYVNTEDFNAAAKLYRKYPALKSDSSMTKDLEKIINRLESGISVVSGPNE